jgi:hypothetical protein
MSRAIIYPVKGGNMEQVQSLLDEGADVNAKDEVISIPKSLPICLLLRQYKVIIFDHVIRSVTYILLNIT